MSSHMIRQVVNKPVIQTTFFFFQVNLAKLGFALVSNVETSIGLSH